MSDHTRSAMARTRSGRERPVDVLGDGTDGLVLTLAAASAGRSHEILEPDDEHPGDGQPGDVARKAFADRVLAAAVLVRRKAGDGRRDALALRAIALGEPAVEVMGGHLGHIVLRGHDDVAGVAKNEERPVAEGVQLLGEAVDMGEVGSHELSPIHPCQRPS